MRSAVLHAAFVALLLVPAIAGGGSAAAPGGGNSSPGATGEKTGAYGQSIPLFLNITFTGRTLAAQDWYEKGFILTSGERYREALQAYEKALSCNRSLLNAWYYSGDALFRLGRYREAILAFENATAIDPDFVDAYFYEGRVYERLGLYREQQDALGKGLEAADRRKAAEEAGTSPPRAAREPVSQPVPSAIPLVGTVMAIGLLGFIRRKGFVNRF